MERRISVGIKMELYERLTWLIQSKESGFGSVDEYVEYIIESFLKGNRMMAVNGNSINTDGEIGIALNGYCRSMSIDEEEEIKHRLKALGYI
ncbi:MAG: hypothetical protein QW416_08775 [Candidatus Nitrosocaldaceae archaeon]